MLQLANLRRLYGANPCVRAILDHFAASGEPRDETSVEEMWVLLAERAYAFSRPDVIKAFKSLQHVGAGAFIVGRRRYPSRFLPLGDVVELAKAARGEREAIPAPFAPAPAPSTTTAAAPAATAAGDPATVIAHRYILRPDFPITVQLPADLTKAEATRLAEFIRTLPFA